jgi:hypothetical protein
MTLDDFRQSLTATEPPAGLSHALAGLWWDKKGDWDASARIRSAGRRHRGFVGARLPASQGRRSRQRSILVQPGGQARVPGAAGCGVDEHCDSFAGIERARLFVC